jgi:hypothetical protein
MSGSIETENSLTLDTDACTRAQEALSRELDGGWNGHFCTEWTDGDDGCEVCWRMALAVLRAAEGLRLCKRCNGLGDVGSEAGAVCCDECGGNGLEPLEGWSRQ